MDKLTLFFPSARGPSCRMTHCTVLQVLQRAMKSQQGVIKEFSVDDKGTVMVGALGLPPITGANPSARACMAALKIMKGIQVCCVPPTSPRPNFLLLGRSIINNLPAKPCLKGMISAYGTFSHFLCAITAFIRVRTACVVLKLVPPL